MEKVTQKFEEGSAEVLAQLGRAVRVIHGVRDRDLEQEAFIRALEAFRRADRVEHPRALIWKIVRDTVADHWRTRLRNDWDDIDTIPERFIAQQTHLEEDLDRATQVELLRDAILRLGCDIRGPVYLFYMESYSIRKIARIYGKSSSAVKMALHRGRRQLERMFRANATNKSRSWRH